MTMASLHVAFAFLCCQLMWLNYDIHPTLPVPALLYAHPSSQMLYVLL